MEEIELGKNEEVVMKLLYYFITEQGYNPIILHGAKDEIWLENMDKDYEVVRIVSGYIHNDEQLNFDLFKTRQILKKVKKSTFSFKVNTLSLFVNIGDNVHMEEFQGFPKIDIAKIDKMDDLNNYDFIMNEFPNITCKTDLKEEGMNLFLKITEEISHKNEESQKKAENVFKKRKPIITDIIILINIIVFLSMYLFGYGSEDNATLIYFGANVRELILQGDYYRLITAAFLHIGIIHILCNMYALYIVGSQIENFYGKTKFTIIYLFSAICGNLLAMLSSNTISAGASGAIFGLFGALLYFGYHYRVYLGSVLKSQLIPLIILNLLMGFVLPGVDGLAHIGGLIGGILISAALGVKYKSTTYTKVNATILTTIFTLFLIYVAFFMNLG
jgi:rhomboid protease GluP